MYKQLDVRRAQICMFTDIIIHSHTLQLQRGPSRLKHWCPPYCAPSGAWNCFVNMPGLVIKATNRKIQNEYVYKHYVAQNG